MEHSLIPKHPKLSIQENYVMAKDLYIKKRKPKIEIEAILKKNGLRQDTIELILQDVDLYAEVNSKIRIDSRHFIGMLLLMNMCILILLNPELIFHSTSMNLWLFLFLILVGLLLCFNTYIKTFIQKSIAKLSHSN